MADAAAAAAAAPEVYAAAEAEEKMPEIRLALCKGRMKEGVFKLFGDAGIKVSGRPRTRNVPMRLGNLVCLTAASSRPNRAALPQSPRCCALATLADHARQRARVPADRVVGQLRRQAA